MTYLLMVLIGISTIYYTYKSKEQGNVIRLLLILSGFVIGEAVTLFLIEYVL